MIKGECPNCGRAYYGQALRQPEYRTCEKCGAALVLSEDLRRLSSRLPAEGSAERNIGYSLN